VSGSAPIGLVPPAGDCVSSVVEELVPDVLSVEDGDVPPMDPLRPWRIRAWPPDSMQSFIIRACACTCETSAASFASILIVAPFFVFSTFTSAFDMAAGSHLPPAPAMEPCIPPLIVPVLVLGSLLVLVLVLGSVLVLVSLLRGGLDVVDPGASELVLPAVPDMLPLLPVPEPEVEPELPCACAPTANANATTATRFLMNSSSAATCGPPRNLGMVSNTRLDLRRERGQALAGLPRSRSGDCHAAMRAGAAVILRAD
jgi:hypothetical protein